jgi:hypothetical protein
MVELTNGDGTSGSKRLLAAEINIIGNQKDGFNYWMVRARLVMCIEF